MDDRNSRQRGQLPAVTIPPDDIVTVLPPLPVVLLLVRPSPKEYQRALIPLNSTVAMPIIRPGMATSTLVMRARTAFAAGKARSWPRTPTLVTRIEDGCSTP